MAQWFETKVKYDKTLETGALSTVSEAYLVDALSFTEAESRIIEEMTPFVHGGELLVTAVKKEKLADVLFSEGDKWYKVKQNMITVDEKTAKEKRTASFVLVRAFDFKGALDNFLAAMKGITWDYEIASIVETPLMDVFGADLAENAADREVRQKAQEAEKQA